MKSRNHYVYGNAETLKNLAEEYRDYCGREVKVEDDRLVILALPARKPKKEKREPRVDRASRD